MRILIGAITAILALAGSAVNACSIHDHLCRFHSIGRPSVPSTFSGTSDTGLYAYVAWDSEVDLDIHALLPSDFGPYDATGSGEYGNLGRTGEPYTDTGEQTRHVYYGQYEIDYYGGDAIATVSPDIIGGGGSGNPQPECSVSDATYCELVSITGDNVPEGTYAFTTYNYNITDVSPETSYYMKFVTTGNGYVVNASHLPDTNLYGSFSETGQVSDEITVVFGNYGFTPHAIGTTAADVARANSSTLNGVARPDMFAFETAGDIRRQASLLGPPRSTLGMGQFITPVQGAVNAPVHDWACDNFGLLSQCGGNLLQAGLTDTNLVTNPTFGGEIGTQFAYVDPNWFPIPELEYHANSIDDWISQPVWPDVVNFYQATNKSIREFNLWLDEIQDNGLDIYISEDTNTGEKIVVFSAVVASDFVQEFLIPVSAATAFVDLALNKIPFGKVFWKSGKRQLDNLLPNSRFAATNRGVNDLPSNSSQLGHIFRNDVGHLPDTPVNRQLLVDITNNSENFVGVDRFGNDVYTTILPNGSQIWGYARNSVIQNGGLNNPPKIFVTGHGLE